MHLIMSLVLICLLIGIGNFCIRLIFGIGWFTWQLLKVLLPIIAVLLIIAAFAG